MNRPDIICVSPVLPEDVRHQIEALSANSAGLRVFTSFAYTAGSPVERAMRQVDALVGSSLHRRTERRKLDAHLARQLICWPWMDVWQKAARLAGLASGGPRAQDCCFGAIDRIAARSLSTQTQAVIGREDACSRTFRAAKIVGAACLYDLPTAHYQTVRRVMADEAREFGKHQPLEQEYAHDRNRRKDRELSLADHVVVASSFVRESVEQAGIGRAHVTTIPYGCPPPVVPTSVRRPVVLYVGHLSLRKGTLRLLRVWKRLGAYRTHQLRLIGKLHLPASALEEYRGNFEHIPHLPRPELWQHYAAARLFVFPSAADGFGIVMNEALACGTPVLASSNTGAPGFITPGVEGLIYPFGDDDALAASLDRMLTRTDETAAMGQAALELARRWSWEEYRRAFVDLVKRLLSRES